MTNKTRISLFIFGLLLGGFVAAVSAEASGGGEGSNTGCNGVGNPNSPCEPGGPNVPPPHQPPVYPPELPPIVVTTPVEVVNNPINSNANVGINENTNNNSSIGIGQATATGGNASATGGNASASGGAGGAGGTGGTASLSANLSVGATAGSSSNSSNSANNAGNASNTVVVEGDAAQKRNPVSSAVAPAMSIMGVDQCLVPFGLGVQAVGFGVAAGGAIRDETCEKLKLARQLDWMGHKDVAIQLLRQDKRVDDAFKAMGK